MSQLALPLKLADHAVFDSYYAGRNGVVVDYLLSLIDTGRDSGCWLWGAHARGKTHLLQAVCERSGNEAIYLPLAELAATSADVLDGLADRRIVCLDDLHAVAGSETWELELFEMWNQLSDNGGNLVIAASTTPRECQLELEDLRSRLSRMPAYHIKPLDDAERVKALQLRANHRGLALSEKTAAYILNRSRRDMASLYRQLDQLDTEALRAQRNLSIPFVRDVLGF